MRLGAKTLPETVAPTPRSIVSLGIIEVEPGKLELAVEATKIVSPELLRLRGVVFTLHGAEPTRKATAPAGEKKRH